MSRPRFRTLVTAAALVIALGSTACLRGNGARAAIGALHVAAAVAEVVAVASILAYHDAHFHSHHCGHSYRWYEGRYNYWYNGQWEYYDADERRWYAY